MNVVIPKGFMNVAISLNGHLIADTNDSQNWKTFKKKLPIGKWAIQSIDNTLVKLRRK